MPTPPHYGKSNVLWPKFRPKFIQIATEFPYRDRHCDQNQSVVKPLVELDLWPTNSRSENFFTEFVNEKFGQKNFWPTFRPKFRSQNMIPTELWPKKFGRKKQFRPTFRPKFKSKKIIATDLWPKRSLGKKFPTDF